MENLGSAETVVHVSSYKLCLVHTSDGDGSTKFHTNPVKRRRNRRERKGFFSPVPSPFYKVYMELGASVSASVCVASVNQALKVKRL